MAMSLQGEFGVYSICKHCGLFGGTDQECKAPHGHVWIVTGPSTSARPHEAWRQLAVLELEDDAEALAYGQTASHNHHQYAFTHKEKARPDKRIHYTHYHCSEYHKLNREVCCQCRRRKRCDRVTGKWIVEQLDDPDGTPQFEGHNHPICIYGRRTWTRGPNLHIDVLACARSKPMKAAQSMLINQNMHVPAKLLRTQMSKIRSLFRGKAALDIPQVVRMCYEMLQGPMADNRHGIFIPWYDQTTGACVIGAKALSINGMMAMAKQVVSLIIDSTGTGTNESWRLESLLAHNIERVAVAPLLFCIFPTESKWSLQTLYTQAKQHCHIEDCDKLNFMMDASGSGEPVTSSFFPRSHQGRCFGHFSNSDLPNQRKKFHVSDNYYKFSGDIKMVHRSHAGSVEAG